MGNWVDLSHTIKSEMPLWEGDPKTTLSEVPISEEHSYFLSKFETTFHVGTHMDFPAHFQANGKKASDYEPDFFCRKVILFDFEPGTGEEYLSEERLDTMMTKWQGKLRHLAVFVRTGWSRNFGTKAYFTDYPILPERFARFLIQEGVRIVGLDTPSPDRLPYLIHQFLLAEEILIIENLTKLSVLPENQFLELNALPLNIDAEASFVRPIVYLP